MSSRAKTMKIVLDGEIGKFSTEFNKANDLIRETKSEAVALQKSLKYDVSTENLVAAQNAATASVEATTQKVELLKKAISQVSQSGDADAPKSLKMLNVELIKAQNEADTASKRLNNVMGAEFASNIKNSNSEIDLTNRKLASLKEGLSLKWDNDTFKQAQKEAQTAVDQTQDRVELLQKELIRINSVDTDNVQMEFEQLSTQLGEAKIKAQQAQKEMTEINKVPFDRASGTLDKLSSAFMRSGMALTAGVTVPLAYVGKEAISMASSLSEAQNVVDVAFKDSASSVNQWSQSLLESNGLSELTAKTTAGLFKTMANGMGVADEAGTAMAKNLTELIPDIASFMDKSFDEVSTKLKAVFTGETEGLKDLGVVMTEANLNSFALANGMNTLSNDMEQGEKVALRYKFVLDALKDAQGDFSRTLDTSMANQMRLAQEQFKTLAVTLAQELLPIATDLLKWANDVIKGFNEMSESQKKATLTVLGLAAALGPTAMGVSALLQTIKGGRAVISTANSLLEAFKTANNAATVSQAALNAVMSVNPIALVTIALAGITAAVVAYSYANDEAAKKQREVNQEIANLESGNIKEASGRIAELELAASNTVPRIEKLGEITNRTAGENELLRQYIEQLNTVMGYEAAAIDEVTGKLRMNTAEIYSNVEALKNKARAETVSDKMKAEAGKLVEIEMDIDGLNLERKMLEAKKKSAKEQQEELKKLSEKLNGEDFGVNEEWQDTYANILAIDDEITDITNKINQKEELAKPHRELIDAYGEYATNAMKDAFINFPNESIPLADNVRQRQLAKEPTIINENEVKKAKNLLDDQRSVNMLSEQGYYEKLKALLYQHYGSESDITKATSDLQKQLIKEVYNAEVSLQQKSLSMAQKYSSEKTSAYKDASAEQQKIAKETFDKSKKLAKDAYDQNKKHLKESFDDSNKKLKEEYDADVKAIEAAYKAKEKSIKAQIKAIDDEIEARRRLKQEEEHQSETDAIKAQLSFGKLDEFTRRELEEQLKRLEEEQAEYKWELEQEDRKTALEEELTNAKELFDRKKEHLQETFELQQQFLQTEYDTNIQMLDTVYAKHTEQLEAMFQNSSTELGKISKSFVDTITSGCELAAQTLRGAIDNVHSAQALAQGRNAYYNDTSSRTTNFNIPQGMTVAQVERIVQRELFN